ncbi:TFB4 [Brettanomyces bruxellensis]|uniref:General transcription and DNA repair factor IIH subunit TFB4 n=1 Tax=Dekkera bruxellensis TaxID=5007 RepID=A0A7D9GY15_DEKBR|nr:TFB4 [Brettanomyces bruxellensis]
MDAIADRAFVGLKGNAKDKYHILDETPSLLTVILDINPLEWKKLMDSNNLRFKDVTSALLVMLNSHMALNSGNKVSLYIANSFYHGAKLVFPSFDDDDNDDSQSPNSKEKVDDNSSLEEEKVNEIVKKKRSRQRKVNASRILETTGIYRQFRIIDETIVDSLDKIIKNEPSNLKSLVGKGETHIKGTLSGALSQALSYINRFQNSDEHSGMKARIVCISVSGDNTLPYVSIMNSIFAAQKQKVSVDVCKLGPNSTFLQQASDSTNGVYIYIKHPLGLIQYLSTALFIDPMLRPMVVLPTNTNIDFRASCFITNKVVDIGYVCSVCLCILSVIPEDEICPTCHSKLDHDLIVMLKRKPRVLPLVKKAKRKRNSSTPDINPVKKFREN